jgi:hypothetical protein
VGRGGVKRETDRRVMRRKEKRKTRQKNTSQCYNRGNVDEYL